MNTPQRIFYGCIESGTIWDGEQQARDYHAKAQYPDYPIIELVERTPVVATADEMLALLKESHRLFSNFPRGKHLDEDYHCDNIGKLLERIKKP